MSFTDVNKATKEIYFIYSSYEITENIAMLTVKYDLQIRIVCGPEL